MKKNNKPKIIEAEVVAATPVELYHAQHPEVRRLRETQIAEIGELIGDLREKFKPLIKEFFADHAQPLWIVAMKIAEFCDGLPGRELTEDLYRQFVFTDANGQTISRWLLCELCKLGRKFPNGIDKTFSVTDLWRQLPMMFGEQEQLKLTNGDKPKSETKMPDNPFDYFRTIHVRATEDKDATAKYLEAFAANPQFGDFATLSDRRPELHFEMHKKLSEAVAARLADAEAMLGVLQVMGAPER